MTTEASASHVVTAVPLVDGVGAWFTGRAAGNLSHRRPHEPSELARARSRVLDAIGLPDARLHLMQQVHGGEVGTIGPDDPPGAEVRAVDALVTAETARPLAVQVADCVPVLLASSEGPVAAAHAGRKGVASGVVEAALARLADLGAPARTVRAAIGPAIGGCCYEVPAEMRDDIATAHPAARAETTWGTPALDLPAAVAATLADAGVEIVFGGPDVDRQAAGLCTRCDPEQRWFSHRADAASGRMVGIVARLSDRGDLPRDREGAPVGSRPDPGAS